MQNRILGLLIKSQQFYISQLGFYDGKINGVWDKNWEAAMELFKLDKRFFPANKKRNNGPFMPFERLPKGFKWEVLDGQRAIIKVSNTSYQMIIHELVNGILNSEKTGETRDAADMLNTRVSKRDDNGSRESISDFVNP